MKNCKLLSDQPYQCWGVKNKINDLP